MEAAVAGAAAVVVDPQASAHIQVAHRGAELVQLHVDAGCLLQGVFDDSDVVDLAAHMEVKQAQFPKEFRIA